jgi:hypothetical protein
MIDEAALDSNQATIEEVAGLLSDPGPGALAEEYKSIFTARYEAGSSVRHGAGTSFGVDNTRTPSVLHHFNSILTSHVSRDH